VRNYSELKNVATNEKLLGRGVERHHWEYIQGSSTSTSLKILVVSDRMEPLFSSGK
jgi:hypothetical protein